MDLRSFELYLNENKMSVMSMRLKELRALNKPAQDIVKEFAREFYSEDTDGMEKAKKFLVGRKPFLKNYANMSNEEVNKLPKKEMEKLRNRYSKYMSVKEFNTTMNRNKNPNEKILKIIMDKVIENG